jgi:diguanylate cyclase (GGDEF)-like protein
MTGPTARVWALNAVLTLAAAGLLAAIRDLPPVVAGPSLPWWALAALFAVAEVWVVHIQFRREAHTLSLSEIPLTVGLFFLSPPLLILAQVVGAAPALIFRRRQPALKAVFNLAQLATCGSVAMIIFRAGVSPGLSPGPASWLMAIAATTVSGLVGVILVFVVISLSEGRVTAGKWAPVVAFAVGGSAVTTSLALVGVTILYRDPRAVVLLMAPAAALYAAYLAYTRERLKTERIEFLYNSGRTLAGSPAADSAIVRLLEQAVAQFRADVAEVTISGSQESSLYTRTSIREGIAEEVDHPVAAGEDAEVLELVMAREKGLIIMGDTADEKERRLLETRKLSDAIVTSLEADNRVIGTILVGNRLGYVGPFNEDDLNLLDTLATQVGAAVENARLERVLTHQAFHDSLTNLANRALFGERLDHALDRRNPRVAVLLVDIDDFKVVNDTLGHTVGDQMLVAVAERLAASTRASDTAARLGGDEFAVLVEEIASLEDATAAATRILESLRRPLLLAGEELRVGASIGIAADMEGQLDAGALLLHADVAMYAAKRSGRGAYRVFEPSMQDEVQERHALREDLRVALEQGELVNYYQPLVSLDGRTVHGAEALVRWVSPKRGLVAPAYFIRVAEESGLIVDLGRWVLREACRQAREWHREFPAARPLSVSVNLSAVQIQQPGFVDEVVSALADAGLEPRHLTLEITESTFMDDTRAAIARLRELRGLGIRLELDDFGTGYSSLSILRDLPLDGLKIDKAFVDLLHDASDRPAFLQAIVRLAQALDLEMVAEGIEHEVQAAAVHAMGCQVGQGYLFSRPVPPHEFRAFLTSAVLEAGDGKVVPISAR